MLRSEHVEPWGPLILFSIFYFQGTAVLMCQSMYVRAQTRETRLRSVKKHGRVGEAASW